MLNRLNATAYLFRFSCLVIFIYQAWISFEDFFEKRTFSNSRFSKQENVSLPQVCISTGGLEYDSFNNSLNISMDEYEDGKWKVAGYSEKEIWNFISPRLTDLINDLYVYKTLLNNSEKYSKIKIPMTGKNVDDLRAYGLDIKEKDYYSSPKIFCIIFRYPFRYFHHYINSHYNQNFTIWL